MNVAWNQSDLNLRHNEPSGDQRAKTVALTFLFKKPESSEKKKQTVQVF